MAAVFAVIMPDVLPRFDEVDVAVEAIVAYMGVGWICFCNFELGVGEVCIN
jgi:hypothetical protein